MKRVRRRLMQVALAITVALASAVTGCRVEDDAGTDDASVSDDLPLQMLDLKQD
jgi:hypothetical protein